MVAPIGSEAEPQYFQAHVPKSHGLIDWNDSCDVSFVPLVQLPTNVWIRTIQADIKEVIMKRGFLFGLATVAACAALSIGPAFADVDDGSKVTIISPKDGDKVGDAFELKYELVKGSQAQHGHVYLDGEPQKKFPGTFKGLSKGKHEIKIQAATHDHDHLAATDTITVEVN